MVIRTGEGRAIEIDELLDEARGSAPKVAKAFLITALGLLALFVTWIVIVLVFPE